MQVWLFIWRVEEKKWQTLYILLRVYFFSLQIGPFFSLMSDNPKPTECAVCHWKTPKTRVHYGSVSCYSCRAFFRRNTRSGKTKKCKIDQHCAVSYMEHKQCTHCRYQKCLRWITFQVLNYWYVSLASREISRFKLDVCV